MRQLTFNEENRMPGPHDITQGTSPGDLGREAVTFLFHTFMALVLLGAVIVGMTMNHPDADAVNPKLLATVLAFIVPMVGGFFIARRQQNDIASYVWISGVVVFAVV